MLKYKHIFSLLFCVLVQQLLPQQNLTASVLLDPAVNKLCLENYTSVYKSPKQIEPRVFIKNQWKGFVPYDARTFVFSPSEEFTYLKVNFQNKSSEQKSFLVQLKQSILPHLRFFWYNVDSDTCFELAPLKNSRTSVVQLPKLSKLYRGILLIEFRPKNTSSPAALHLFGANTYYDYELNIIFIYSVLFGFFLLQLILVLYSIYLSKSWMNAFYAITIICTISLLVVYNGFAFIFNLHSLRLPHYLPSLLFILLNLFMLLFLSRLFRPDIPSWLNRLNLYFIGVIFPALIALLISNGILASRLIFPFTLIVFAIILVNLIVAIQNTFSKYVYFLTGFVLSIIFYSLQLALRMDFLPESVLTYYGMDIGLSAMTLFTTLGLIRNVFAERLMGERLIKENQIVLIEAENKLNLSIEEENKLLLSETDELYRQISAARQQIQQRRTMLKRKESTLNEIETVIRNADGLIEDVKNRYLHYLNLSDDHIILINSPAGNLEFINQSFKDFLAKHNVEPKESALKLFSERDAIKLKEILGRVFNGYYYLSVLEHAELADGELSGYHYQFIPIKRSNGKVIMALGYSLTG